MRFILISVSRGCLLWISGFYYGVLSNGSKRTGNFVCTRRIGLFWWIMHANITCTISSFTITLLSLMFLLQKGMKEKNIHILLVDTVWLNYGSVDRICIFLECTSLLNILYMHDPMLVCSWADITVRSVTALAVVALQSFNVTISLYLNAARGTILHSFTR